MGRNQMGMPFLAFGKTDLALKDRYNVVKLKKD
jgi:hypothetical protein